MVNDSGAREKAKRLLGAIRAAMTEGANLGAEMMVANALTRTPTVDQEYNILMEGEGGVSSVPRVGGSSVPDADGRQPLIKSEETYLENVVPSPANISVQVEDGNGFVRFGNLAALNAATIWEYTNYSTREGILGPYKHGPYFFNFENGSLDASANVRPVFTRNTSSGGSSFYPLRPDFDRTEKVMYKPVYPKRIFAPELLEPIFRNAMESALSQVGPGKGRD